MGEFPGPLHDGGGDEREEKGRVLLLQVSNWREVGKHARRDYVLMMFVCLFSVGLMCTTGCPRFWRPFTEIWKRVGVVRMPSWCPTASSADCFS